MISPPSLMDDVDAVQAQIARNMLDSGDWVTARLDGVMYIEKAPLIYWMMAVCYKIFGVHDWSARIPVVLSSIGLAWLTAAFGMWAFGRKAGFYAGLVISTCVGLFLFTRIQIPDVMVALAMALSMWAFLRAISDDEPHPKRWAYIFAAALGTSLLLKSLIGVVFPVAACLIYLAVTQQLGLWKRLRPLEGIAIIAAIAAPWHILATLRNPPYFDLTFHSTPGEYHGFLWFFVMNEQVLRFLNLRYPRDYNTVPRIWFWLFHLLWMFPWSLYFPSVLRLSYKPTDRAGKTRLLCLCWTGFILVFFSFSTTQEYYSMPCYPALALLLGSAMALENRWNVWSTRALSIILALCGIAAGTLWFLTRGLPTPGDISSALSSNPDAYTLSLGHIEDLTLKSFAYLRAPLLAAAIAFAAGAIGTMFFKLRRAYFAAAIMAVLFFQAARMALVVFDPYMTSRPLADALLKAPKGKLIVDHHYYTFSSVFFYTNRRALLLNGRFNNLVYGSYAPGAPDVFIDDAQFAKMWNEPERCYLVASEPALQRIAKLVPADRMVALKHSGGKVILTNLGL